MYVVSRCCCSSSYFWLVFGFLCANFIQGAIDKRQEYYVVNETFTFFCFLQLIQFPRAKVIQLFFDSVARNPLQCTRAVFNSFTLLRISIFCSQNNYSRTCHIRINNNRGTNYLDNRISITRVKKYKEITSHSEKLVDYILNASLMYIG